MKTKPNLLFWLNGFFLHFSLAYYLQSEIDANFFGIVDINSKPKKFFESQKLVNFKKNWYFHDNIDLNQKNPDLEYLLDFENKYNINLWKIVINERFFYKHNRFYKFQKEEILSILEQELKLFEKEINQVLLSEKNEMTLVNQTQIAKQFAPEITGIQSEITALKAEITSKEEETNALYEIYIGEAEGRKGTKLLGKGPVYKEKREKHDAALSALSQLKKEHGEKIKNKELAIDTLLKKQELTQEKTRPIIANFDGLMARMNALNALPWLPSFFIFLLFLATETSPIFAKLIAPKGEYDFKLEEQESAVKTWVDQQIQQR